MLETVDKNKMNYTCNKIVENEKIIENNAKFWTLYLDNQLKEFVILYNFNFFEVANRFHGFISIDKRYEFNENEIRRHWSFLHAMRYLNFPVDNEYYLQLKKRFNIEEEMKVKQVIEEENRRKEELKEKKRREEEEEEKRNQENIQKVKYERFNLITIDTNVDGLNENLNGLEKEKEEIEKIKLKDNRNIQESLNDDSTQDRNTQLPTEGNIVDTSNVVTNIINDSKCLGKSSNDFFESDDFINAIFKKENKLIETIGVENNITKFKDNNEIIESYEDNLFPISTCSKSFLDSKANSSDKTSLNNPELIKFNQQNIVNSHKLPEEGLIGIERDLENTRSFDDLIRDDSKLKEQYENLDTYYNFAVKSLNYFIPKLGKGLNDEEKSENDPAKNEVNNFQDDVIKKTSYKINQLLMDSVKLFI